MSNDVLSSNAAVSRFGAARRRFPLFALSLVLVALLGVLPGCQGSSISNLGNGGVSQRNTTTSNAAGSSGSTSTDTSVLLAQTPDYPEYSGSAYAAINGNKPYFTDNELAQAAGTEVYGALDNLGRCTGAFAIVGKDTLPTDERGEIYTVHPTGWQHSEYSFVDGLSLYNRCHLIAYSLTDEDANECNLVTGTRSMNLAEIDFEQEALDYVSQKGGHVAYRATPVFEGSDLVCRGILLEAQSVEDAGASVCFCVFFYNVEPGVDIDYATGANELASPDSVMYSATLEDGAATGSYLSSGSSSSGTSSGSSQGEVAASIDESVQLTYVDSSAEAKYVLNTRTGKFHTPACENAASISEGNRRYTTSSRDDVLSAGYTPGGCCNP